MASKPHTDLPGRHRGKDGEGREMAHKWLCSPVRKFLCSSPSFFFPVSPLTYMFPENLDTLSTPAQTNWKPLLTPPIGHHQLDSNFVEHQDPQNLLVHPG